MDSEPMQTHSKSIKEYLCVKAVCFCLFVWLYQSVHLPPHNSLSCLHRSVAPQGHSQPPVHPPLLVTSNGGNKGKPGPPPILYFVPETHRHTHTHTHTLKENKEHCFTMNRFVCALACISLLMCVSMARERMIDYTLALTSTMTGSWMEINVSSLSH